MAILLGYVRLVRDESSKQQIPQEFSRKFFECIADSLLVDVAPEINEEFSHRA
jgi:hypothetical protein